MRKLFDITVTALFKLAVAIALLLFLVCLHPALAKWKQKYANAAPNIQAWYQQQHNKQGEWCCDKSDGHPYYGGVKFLPNGGVELDGGHKLPAYMVLTGPNPTGHAVWWHTGVRDYCFALPTMG